MVKVKVHGKHPVRIFVVILIGLHASARMTACCACLGVGFIVISFYFYFLRMQDVARNKQCRTSALAEAQSRPGHLLPAPISFHVVACKIKVDTISDIATGFAGQSQRYLTGSVPKILLVENNFLPRSWRSGSKQRIAFAYKPSVAKRQKSV